MKGAKSRSNHYSQNIVFLVVSIGALFLGVAIVLAIGLFFSGLLRFIIANISPDHHITELGKQWILALLFPLGFALMAAGVLELLLTRVSFKSKLSLIFQDDPLPGSVATESQSYNVLLFITVFTIVFTGLYTFVRGFPGFLGEGGIIELSQEFVLLGALILIFYAAHILKKRDLWQFKKRSVIFLYLFLSAVFFLVGMEEISWGQWIFRWQTPSFIRNANGQGETNIHNLFSASQYMVYYFIAISILLLFILASAFLRRKGQKTEILVLTLPHPAFFVPVVFLLGINVISLFFIGLPTWHEFQEVFVDVLVLFYSWTNLKRLLKWDKLRAQ